MRILVVEDERKVASFVRRAVEAEQHTGDVVLRVNSTAVDSVEAVKAAVADTPSAKSVLLLVRPVDGHDRLVTVAAR